MYYNVAILGLNIEELVYESELDIECFTKVSVKLVNKTYFGIIISKSDKPDFKTKPILNIYDEYLTPNQIELLNFMSKYYVANFALCADIFVFANKKQDIDKKYNNKIDLVLSNYQNECLKHCKNNKMNLIFGDTGSGKTEIYTKLINDCINDGKQVLFLMPEISLTPQMCKRMDKHFKDLFIVWHSKVTKTKKQKNLDEFLLGNKPLVIGARSALFLPFTNLGLIIVDEEHDNSYKSSIYPYYNARDLAIYLSNITQAKLVLGSATPSLQSFYNNNLAKFRLKGTYHTSNKEFLYDNSLEIPSEKLLNELKQNLANHKQSIVFLPVRGNYRQVVCKECNNRKTCPNCSVPMSLHKNIYKCHYCGKKEKLKNFCESCGSSMLESKIIGTAELKNKLELAIPNAKIAKLDSDELSSSKKLQDILNDFSNNKIDILVGTQLISKGHDYKNVTFCAILGLDEYLFYADFKARENTLSLAIQVAGRAGRAGDAKILINTQYKDFFESYLKNYDDFLLDEQVFRKNYPPNKRLLRLLITSKSDEEANNICEHILKQLNINNFNGDCELVGYGKCAIEKIKNDFRYYILLRSNKKMLLSNLALFYKQLPKVTIDIDPVNFS